MSNAPDQEETLQEDVSDAQPDDATDTMVEIPTTEAPETAVVPETPSESAPASASAPEQRSASPGNLAELSAQFREAAAEIAEIAAQAGRLGIAIDAAKALREGTSPETLRKLVLQRAADASDARDVIAAAPSPILPKASESPIVAAAKRAAANPRG